MGRGHVEPRRREPESGPLFQPGAPLRGLRYSSTAGACALATVAQSRRIVNADGYGGHVLFPNEAFASPLCGGEHVCERPNAPIGGSRMLERRVIAPLHCLFAQRTESSAQS